MKVSKVSLTFEVFNFCIESFDFLVKLVNVFTLVGSFFSEFTYFTQCSVKLGFHIADLRVDTAECIFYFSFYLIVMNALTNSIIIKRAAKFCSYVDYAH